MSEGRGITKRAVLVLLVVALVLFGLGAGTVDREAPGSPAEAPASTPGTAPSTDPGEPTVTVTPPGTSTPPSDVEQSTTTPTTPSSPTASPTPSHTVSLSVDASSPDDVVNDDGRVGPLWGSVSGRLTWEGSVDSVVVVVSVLVPGEGWAERQRVTVRPEGDAISLQSLLDGENYRYLTGDLTRGFDNHDGGTTVGRAGAVGVTAVLFDDGSERGRVTETAEYHFEVANSGGVDISLSGPDGDTAGVTAVPSDGKGLAPGADANRSMTVENTGRFAGTVRVFVTNVRGSENGFAGPEAAVDDDPESELLEALQFRIAVVDDGTRRYVLGGPTAWVDLDESVDENSGITSFGLDPEESRTIDVEWRIPPGAGNELMTDTANWDVKFVFESAGGG